MCRVCPKGRGGRVTGRSGGPRWRGSSAICRRRTTTGGASLQRMRARSTSQRQWRKEPADHPKSSGAVRSIHMSNVGPCVVRERYARCARRRANRPCMRGRRKRTWQTPRSAPLQRRRSSTSINWVTSPWSSGGSARTRLINLSWGGRKKGAREGRNWVKRSRTRMILAFIGIVVEERFPRPIRRLRQFAL